MEDEIKVALIQMDLAWERPQDNLKRFDNYLGQLQSETDVVFLPEMFTSAFTMNPENVAEPMNGNTIKWMLLWAKKHDTAIAGSLIIEDKRSYYNRFVWINSDGSKYFYDKRHTFTLAGEDRVYQAGKNDGILHFKGWKVCLRICYDLRFPVWSRNTMDYDLLVYVANWPSPRVHAWETLLQARAIENMSYTIGVNRTGKDAKQNTYPGRSAVYDSLGATVVCASDKEGIFYATLNKDKQVATRSELNFLNDRDSFTLK